MKSNCLWYALDKWITVGGRLGLVRSTHWCIPHVQHHTTDDKLTQFVPFSNLKTPWYSLFGFQGEVVTVDVHADSRGPMKPLCIFLGTCILLFSGGLWVVNRTVKYMFKYMMNSLKVSK